MYLIKYTRRPIAKTSTWTALRNPVFRNMWFASLISGTCVAAQDTAATWTMNRVSDSPLFLSLMSTVASLPFFFFTLPAGALADMEDRKRMMFVMTVWLGLAAGGLALCGWLKLINPYVLLAASKKSSTCPLKRPSAAKALTVASRTSQRGGGRANYRTGRQSFALEEITRLRQDFVGLGELQL